MERLFVWAAVIAMAVVSAACDGTQASSFSPTAPSATTVDSGSGGSVFTGGVSAGAHATVMQRLASA